MRHVVCLCHLFHCCLSILCLPHLGGPFLFFTFEFLSFLISVLVIKGLFRRCSSVLLLVFFGWSLVRSAVGLLRLVFVCGLWTVPCWSFGAALSGISCWCFGGALSSVVAGFGAFTFALVFALVFALAFSLAFGFGLGLCLGLGLVWSWSRLVAFVLGRFWSWSRLVLVSFGLGLVCSWSRLVLVSFGLGPVWSWSCLVLVSFSLGPVWSWSRLVLVPFGLGLFWSWSRLVLVSFSLGRSCSWSWLICRVYGAVPCCVAFSMLRCLSCSRSAFCAFLGGA